MLVIAALAVTCRPPVPNSLPHIVGRASVTGVVRRGDFRNSVGNSTKADVGMVAGVLAPGVGASVGFADAEATVGAAIDGVEPGGSSVDVQAASATLPTSGINARTPRVRAVDVGRCRLMILPRLSRAVPCYESAETTTHRHRTVTGPAETGVPPHRTSR
ncbi:hypothetical protein GCM10028790_05640 [Micromonospora taraxaci]